MIPVFTDIHQLPFINALLVPKLFWYAGLMTKKECLNKRI